ncbi:glycosyltransferase family 2 protein [Teredinibacter turnerae]|uniref:glycosyltransferase family 2 protein n=1 Tax=Teredinibacter turnerae TaxID=2426 RepID=UPI00037B6503|nr:glycosyltransferase family 2 protein [Teredinibacter turnerae]
MSAKLELLIVVINYKTADMVIDCLQTVLPQLKEGQKVALVDNCSGDGSAETLQTWVAAHGEGKVDLILSPENGGFSAGNNIGIKHAEAEHYLLLNSDTLLRDGALATMLDTMTSKRCGFVAPRLEWPDATPQESCFRFHRPISELIYGAATGAVTRLLGRWVVALPVSEKPISPEWASFACIMLRGDMVKDVGLMDEGYFLYYEDVDYCKEAANRGWSIVYQPAARVVHLRGGSSPMKSNYAHKKRLPYYYYASRTRYFAKHYGRLGAFLANSAWLAGRSISKLRELLGKKDIAACEKQFSDIWIQFSSPLKPYRPKS